MTVTPTVAIVGPGAIGTTIAAALHEAGRTPQLFGRSERAQLVLRIDTEEMVVPGPVHTDHSQPVAPVDVVLLAVKNTQIEAAAPWLAALCGPDTVVCALQNGVEQVELLSPHVVSGRVVPSIVWFPAETQPDGSVLLRGAPRLSLPMGPDAAVVHELLQGTRCAVEMTAEFHSQAWRKLLQNAAAGLMALTGRRMAVFARADLAELTLDYLRECLAVARAEGAVLDDSVVIEILDAFRRAPADNGTSILADREAGRPLEWDTRNGVVARRGRAHGIPTPISDVVVPLLAATSDGPG